MINRNSVITMAFLLLTVWIFGCAANVEVHTPEPVSIEEQTPEPVYDIGFYTPPLNTEPYPRVGHDNVKNVIFFIADGTSFNHILASRIKAVGANRRLYLEKLPVVGIQSTHSRFQLITDSAASGTAMATGYKTANGMISFLPDNTKVPTLLEYAKQQGKATGLVATSTITHATPASFAAHVKERGDQHIIAEHFLDNKVNVILGGGRSYFIPQSMEGSEREDDRNLVEDFKSSGYEYVETREELNAANSENLLGLFQIGSCTTVDPEPSLEIMTRKAIEILSRDSDGFFLMVEGSQIDWEAHDNSPTGTVRQTLLFDLAVRAGMEFAQRDGNTLVVITGDHETGGMSVTDGYMNGSKMEVKWTSGSHTAAVLPVFAYGPGAEIFDGYYDNTDIAKKIAQLMKIDPFPGEKYK
ncbi:MAG: alkaline phosphatase [bacterium]|nr:alkaline phosphatase [bacterium]